MYVARSLSDAEKRYSTIEKELLVVVFALQRCHFYTYGRQVTIYTDHRSLLGLVGADLDQMTPRLRRFTERLFPYALKWEYIPGKTNFIPDYLSRKSPAPPTPVDVAEAITFDAADSRFTRLLLGGRPFYKKLATMSHTYKPFQFLRRCVSEGWPRKPPRNNPYWLLRNKLCVSGPFLLLEDDGVCVPLTLSAEALALFHQGHLGVGGMRAKAWRVLYWQGWTKDIQRFVQGCVTCAATASAPDRPPMFMEPPPEYPGDHVAADHFQFCSESYLVCVDLFSGFPFLFRCRSASEAAVLSATQEVFLQTGLPRVFLTDRGTVFMSENFQEFLANCQVRHRVSTSKYPQLNGATERAVRTLKTLRVKSSSAFELFQAVLELQNTPKEAGGQSPADIFLGRSQRTWTTQVPRKNSVTWDDHTHVLTGRQTAVLQRHPRSTFHPDTLWPGTQAQLRNFYGKSETVMVLRYGDAPRAYKIRLPSGVITEHNRRFLFPLPRQQSPTSTIAAMTPRTLRSSPAAKLSGHAAGTPSRSPPAIAKLETALTLSAIHRVAAYAPSRPATSPPNLSGGQATGVHKALLTANAQRRRRSQTGRDETHTVGSNYRPRNGPRSHFRRPGPCMHLRPVTPLQGMMFR